MIFRLNNSRYLCFKGKRYKHFCFAYVSINKKIRFISGLHTVTLEKKEG